MSLASRYKDTITGVQSMPGIWAQDARGAALTNSIVLKY